MHDFPRAFRCYTQSRLQLPDVLDLYISIQLKSIVGAVGTMNKVAWEKLQALGILTRRQWVPWTNHGKRPPEMHASSRGNKHARTRILIWKPKASGLIVSAQPLRHNIAGLPPVRNEKGQ